VNVIKAAVKRSNHFRVGNTVVVSEFEDGDIISEPGLQMTDSISRIDWKRRIPILLQNNTDKFIKLKRGSLVGKIDILWEKEDSN
jgi:hypothetical protein